ncbi:MAG: aminoglycoside phosphotransferase family protein [Verrucomicrobia bacterium]|nr:aminoglycoside phosphotransferase family protein [Verrucomicrobiota bacterium]
MKPPIRQGIYYWKCDRPAAFHGTAQGDSRRSPTELTELLRGVLARHFGRAPDALRDGGGQGNHQTFHVTVAGREYFVRLEDGPERDDYLAVESFVMDIVRARGVPTPQVIAVDASRREVPFAWQILEYVPAPDLNRHFKAGTLELPAIAEQLGRLIATWQEVPVAGFGPFAVDGAQAHSQLRGLQRSYADYFHTRFEAHLDFLVAREFLEAPMAAEIRQEVARHRPLLDLPIGCLVHKDTALWNLLGTERQILAVIDWDDCIAGDPLDDLSLFGCFHGGEALRRAFAGYAAVRPLPPNFALRFWLHLLRNMMFKAVIRVGAGYFNHDSRFFLIGADGDGAALRTQTLGRLGAALRGLRDEGDPFSL